MPFKHFSLCSFPPSSPCALPGSSQRRYPLPGLGTAVLPAYSLMVTITLPGSPYAVDTYPVLLQRLREAQLCARGPFPFLDFLLHPRPDFPGPYDIANTCPA